LFLSPQMKNSRKGRNATFILTFHIIKTAGGYGGNTTLERIMLCSHLYETSLSFFYETSPFITHGTINIQDIKC